MEYEQAEEEEGGEEEYEYRKGEYGVRESVGGSTTII